MAKEPYADDVEEAALDEELEEPLEEGDEEPSAAPAPEPEEGEVESSLEELLAKREARPAEEEEEDDSILATGREEHAVGSSMGVAAVGTGTEYLRSLWALGGLTWGGIGHTQSGNGFLLPRG